MRDQLLLAVGAIEREKNPSPLSQKLVARRRTTNLIFLHLASLPMFVYSANTGYKLVLRIIFWNSK